MYSTSSAFLDALVEAGVTYLFVNLGSDHPALVEAIAEARAAGRAVPEVITCPNEMVGMSAAHGFWQISGVAQAVLVHVECGTQALAGAVHNAAKGRAAMLIFAGASPYTQNGELPGSATNSSSGSRTCTTSAAWCAAICAMTTRSAPAAT
jgi:acetolactate synthase-1/2/3 large subunit